MNYKKINNKNDMEEIINAPLIFGQGIIADALTNGWELIFSSSFKKHLSNVDIKKFIEQVIARKKIFLKNSGVYNHVLFYLWHDRQIGHLCFSFIEGTKDQLPFGISLIFVDTMEPIIEHFIHGSIQNGRIVISDLIDHDMFEKEEEIDDFALEVYCQFL